MLFLNGKKSANLARRNALDLQGERVVEPLCRTTDQLTHSAYGADRHFS